MSMIRSISSNVGVRCWSNMSMKRSISSNVGVKCWSNMSMIRSIASGVGVRCRSNMSMIRSISSDVMWFASDTNPLPVTTSCDIIDPLTKVKYPVFRVLDINGKVMQGVKDTCLSHDHEELKKMMTIMGRIQALDDVRTIH